jgi:hypothetical protein
MTLAVGLSHIACTMLRYFPSIPSFLRAFIMKSNVCFNPNTDPNHNPIPNPYTRHRSHTNNDPNPNTNPLTKT